MKKLNYTYKVLKDVDFLRLLLMQGTAICAQLMYTSDKTLIADIAFCEKHGLENLLRYRYPIFPKLFISEKDICNYDEIITINTEETIVRFEDLQYIDRDSWAFRNGIYVEKSEYDGVLKSFEVYNRGRYLGAIYPADIEDMRLCITKLNYGEDPITGCWEDGLGHCCTLNGWRTEGGEE